MHEQLSLINVPIKRPVLMQLRINCPSRRAMTKVHCTGFYYGEHGGMQQTSGAYNDKPYEFDWGPDAHRVVSAGDANRIRSYKTTGK